MRPHTIKYSYSRYSLSEDSLPIVYIANGRINTVYTVVAPIRTYFLSSLIFISMVLNSISGYSDKSRLFTTYYSFKYDDESILLSVTGTYIFFYLEYILTLSKLSSK